MSESSRICLTRLTLSSLCSSSTIDWRLEKMAQNETRLTLHEETETKWALINLTARIGGRRLLMRNHESAMRRGEVGMKKAIGLGYVPPDLDGVSV